jgi:tungstate transport system permease protein
MDFIAHGVKQAFWLIVHRDSALMQITWVTLRVAFGSTALALLVGIPTGLALGLGRFPGRKPLLILANAGMGLPPVVVGLVVSLFLFRGAPLGGLGWLYTVRGVTLAQALLALPLIVALTAAALQALDPGLAEQARALGASRLRVAALALREARVGVLAAVVAALGSAFSEVGAVVLVGGNIDGSTQTLASAVLVRVGMGDFAAAIALGTVLLGLLLLLAAGLTVAQQRNIT